MNDLPETILQFGGGNFLRGFVDLFVDQANRAGQNVGRIVVVQSTASNIANQLNAQKGKYHVIIRGIRDGRRVDEIEPVHSISRAIDSRTHWQQVLEFSKSPGLRFVVSNTTEAGFNLDARDERRPTGGVAPCSFPAKLLDVLWTRLEAGISKSLTIIPCELLPKNGDRLRELVLEQAQKWQVPAELNGYLTHRCCWLNSLVDRIVSGKPADHPLLASDPLLTVAEPFASWVIGKNLAAEMFTHPSLELTDDTTPFELRKIRILNCSHTALAAKGIPLGIVTVREAVEHPVIGPWLLRLLNVEIVPTIEDRVPDARGFVAATLERFRNPFLEHKLSSIALNHEAKLKARLVPARHDYVSRFGRRPPLLDEILEIKRD